MYLNSVKLTRILQVLVISFSVYSPYPSSLLFSFQETQTDQDPVLDIDSDLGMDQDTVTADISLDSRSSSSSLLLTELGDDFDVPEDEELTGEEKEFFSEEKNSSNPQDDKEEVNSYNSGYILFNFGSQEFRERLGLSAGLKLNSFEFPLKLSYGKWNLEIEDETSYLYELKASNIGTSVAVNYYFTDLIPLFVHLSLGYAFWRGNITPHITDSSEFQENFSSSFNLQSLNFSLGLGWSYFFKNGIFIEHCIYGIGSGFIVKSSFSNSISSKIESASKDKLKHLYGWGLINIGVGKLF